MRQMTPDTFEDYLKRFGAGMKEFVPMLPFAKNQYYDWEQFRTFSDKAIFLIDDLNGEHCLYYLRRMGSALAVQLVMPSSWDGRARIARQSFGSLVRWFRAESEASELQIQVAEYAEFIAFPTLSHHLIPAIIEHGFPHRYMMYMRREHKLPIPGDAGLPDGFERVAYDDGMLEEVLGFYAGDFPGYFINATPEETRAIANPAAKEHNLFRATAVFVRDKAGAIAAGVFATPNDGGAVYPGAFWLDNFAVRPDCRGLGLGTLLLAEEIRLLARRYPGKNAFAYVRRDLREAVADYESMNFVPFEFWMEAKMVK